MLDIMHRTDLIGTAEVAQRLGVDRSTITRWVNAGRLDPVMTVPGYRGNFLFDPEGLAAPHDESTQ